MHQTSVTALVVIVMAALIAVLITLKRSGLLPSPQALQFKARPVMTENEQVFHAILKRSLPDARWEAWPQVSMAAFIAPRKDGSNADPAARKAFWASYGKISNARVDWIVAYDGQARCVIELDDKTHNAAKDNERDAIVKAAGLPTLRFQARNKPDATELRSSILSAVT